MLHYMFDKIRVLIRGGLNKERGSKCGHVALPELDTEPLDSEPDAKHLERGVRSGYAVVQGPEPGTIFLSISGLGAVGYFRRRRQA